ncbi:aldo/keto reductase [Thalassotalea aquiviva]|uniref:aldo/keto reductase n=1 Tax=Thalassotalea aquiviva TaxID=3242415 RepID=UPI00352A38E6
MKFSPLGNSGLQVSRVCLGSMTWGLQNNQQEADAQIEYAMAQGVNFIDTAEMYAIPPSPQTYGKTEEIIGHWLARNPSLRSQLILATKVAGSGLSWIRNGSPISGKSVIEAVDGSLKRLQTDYIDLYQLHWPNRTTPHFGRHQPNAILPTSINRAQEIAQFHDILVGLEHCVKAGKIRHCGLSDDTPWGISQYLNLAKDHNLPMMVSIQNEFSLLHSKDWPYLIEHCVLENIAYLPWSPLAGGLLSGKYLNGAKPKGSRLTLTQRHGNFRSTADSERAIASFCDIAQRHKLTPAQLALAWCDQVDGVTATIIGATTLAQLKENITSFELTLSADVLSEINQTLAKYPQPF